MEFLSPDHVRGRGGEKNPFAVKRVMTKVSTLLPGWAFLHTGTESHSSGVTLCLQSKVGTPDCGPGR